MNVARSMVILWLLLAAWHAVFAADDKSGVSPNTISLPKGPGSIEGLGESFQPTLNTGTASFGVRLGVPPNAAGHTPQLRLIYEGGRGNGPLGFGWHLPLGVVQRKTDDGVPLYPGDPAPTSTDDWSDRFRSYISEQKEDLVPSADGFFFSKNEGLFVRYRIVGDHWESHQSDGTRIEFGLTANGRIHDGAGRVFSWLLEREIDTRGNTITYSYTAFPGPQNTNQKYLSEVRYSAGSPPWNHYHFVRFLYEDRPDWFEDCRAGFIVRTGKRLKRIVVGTQGPLLAGHLAGDFNEDGTPDCLIRRYDLDYLDYAGPESHWSLLAKITLVGADGLTALPATSLGYSFCNPPDLLSAAGCEIVGFNEPMMVMDSPLVDLVDLNGDGLPDILQTAEGGGAPSVGFLNLGELRTNETRSLRWRSGVPLGGDPQAAYAALSSTNVHLADMDGDGLADLVSRSWANTVFYFRNSANLQWGWRQVMSSSDQAPPCPFGDPDVKMADIDFDKRTDIIQSVIGGGGVIYSTWLNLGHNHYSKPIVVSVPHGPMLSGSGVQIVDFNGDRLPDIVRVGMESVTVMAGLGYGRFAAPIEVYIPEGLNSFELGQARLQDINGDGLADLVLERTIPGTLYYWLNLGNYTFSNRKTITGVPLVESPNTVVRWADMNGDGTSDLVYADSSARPRLTVLDFGELLNHGAAVPNVLTSISNGIGRVTLIGYASSLRFALDDAAAGKAWPDPMPNPVQVVSSVTNLDSLGHSYVTRFRYHDGYYDAEEKQFRGFARVDQIDVGDPTAPTLVTRSHFDTGRNYEPMKGKLLRLTAEQEDGKAFWDETTTWTIPPRVLMTGTNGTNVVFVHPIARTKTLTELGKGTERLLESEFAYDAYGNQTTNADYGIVVAGDRSAFNDERITVTDYAVNTNAWILRNPCRQEIKDKKGVVISRTEFYYDDQTFSGKNIGELIIGNLTMKREWIVPGDPSKFVQSARTKYDSFGNPVTLLDPLAVAPGGAIDTSKGHFRQLDYDASFHAYPVTESIYVGEGKEPLIFRAGYDYGFGTVTSSVDFNGNETLYGYDGLARLTSIVKPYDTAEFPTVEYDYVLAQPCGQDGLVNYIETRQLDKDKTAPGDHRSHYFISRQFVDGLGRKLLIKEEANPESDTGKPRVVVKEATGFNRREKPAFVLNPHYTTLGGADLEALLGFEDINAANWAGLFHNEGQIVSLGLNDAHKTVTEYDATLREVKVINPDATFSRKVYEPLLTRSFDENDTDPSSPFHDTPMIHYQDGLGRMVRVDELARLDDDGRAMSNIRTWTTSYEYDLNDQLTHITDSQNNEKFFNYDGLKRKIHMNDPDRGTMDFVYDDASNLIETVDAKGQHITYTYDGANRILTEKYHDGLPPPSWRGSRGDEALTMSVVYHYDYPFPNLPQGDNILTTARNVKGALAWVEDLSGEEHTSYDSRGRVEWVVKRIPDLQFLSHYGSSPLVSYRTAFSYDSLDRNTRLVYPDDDEISYAYDDRSFLRAIIGGVNGLTQDGYVVRSINYAPSGQMERTDCGNGVRTTHTYDSRLRLKQILTVSQRVAPAEELINFAYDFDAVSNIKSITDQRPGSAVPANDPRRNTQVFRYDDLYRLTHAGYVFAVTPFPLLKGWAEGQVPNDEINYRYDRIGNMLSQASTFTNHVEKDLPVADLGEMDSGGTIGCWGRKGRGPSDEPGPHALTKIRNQKFGIRNYPYDANGNMTDIDGLLCTWDFKDRLVAVENNEMRAAYTYDYTDRRITKDVTYKPGTTNFTIHDSRITTLYINKYFEVREHDAPTKYVWNGNTRVARVTGSLNTNLRIQRLRLSLGWNLCSLAVSSASPLRGEGRGEVLSAAFRWNPVTLGWDEVLPSDILPASTVLWLKASTNATLTVTGTYTDPTNRTVTAGGDFLPSAGLEVWNLQSAISNLPSATAWTYDAISTHWLSWLAPPLELSSDLPAFIAPGEAVFVRADAPAQLEVPDSALRICYYHQDHLNSVAALTGMDDNVTYESAYYPFCLPRYSYSLSQTIQPYGHNQMELDDETRLQYCSARYLDPALARFTRVDPEVLLVALERIKDPQRLNPFSYCVNQPMNLTDSSGRSEEPIVSFDLPPVQKPADTSLDLVLTIVDATCNTMTALVETAPGSGFYPGVKVVTSVMDLGCEALQTTVVGAAQGSDAAAASMIEQGIAIGFGVAATVVCEAIAVGGAAEMGGATLAALPYCPWAGMVVETASGIALNNRVGREALESIKEGIGKVESTVRGLSAPLLKVMSSEPPKFLETPGKGVP